MSIDITTTDLELQTVELLPARAALGGGFGGLKIANIHAINLATAINAANFGWSNATAAAVQTIAVSQ